MEEKREKCFSNERWMKLLEELGVEHGNGIETINTIRMKSKRMIIIVNKTSAGVVQEREEQPQIKELYHVVVPT